MKSLESVAFTAVLGLVFPLAAADYYVAPTGNDAADGSAATPFATIDKAIGSATHAVDVIHAAAGEYTTTTQWGPNLKARLIGEGAARDAVVIRSGGAYRTLRMADGSWIENVTIIGEESFKADKGGAIEMSGGTVTNCVIKSGTASGNDSGNCGGNMFVNSSNALVVDCEIFGGQAKNRGGNICIDGGGTVKNCAIYGGVSAGGSKERHGGNVWSYKGTVDGCSITNGTAERAGNVYLYNSAARLLNSTLVQETGTVESHGGNVFQKDGATENCTLIGGKAPTAGGNIHLQAGTVKGCVLKNGWAGGSGGNLYTTGGKVEDCVVEEGVVAYWSNWDKGGANVYLNPGTLVRSVVTGGSIEKGADGLTSDNGGGVRARSTSLVEGCLVYKNSNGGILMESTCKLYNNTVVANMSYGIWGYATKSETVVNCILYGNRMVDGQVRNWHGDRPDAHVTTVLNCAFEDADLATRYTGCLQLEDTDCFVNAAEDDYRLVKDSVLQDKGATDVRAEASATDLAKNPRTSGPVDIGCYEYQKSDMTVSMRFDGAMDHQYVPVTAHFIASVEHAPEGAEVTYEYDFGDGSDRVMSVDGRASHEYVTPGSYTLVIWARAGGSEATMVYANYVSVMAKTIYVTAGNAGAAFPYDTADKGFATVGEAVAVAQDGCAILIGEGVYGLSAPVEITKAVSVIGNTVRNSDVVLKNTAPGKRVLIVNNANAFVSGLTIEGGNIAKGNGANLNLSAGTVSNCVLRAGTVTGDASGEYAGGAGASIGGGLLTHTQIVGNEVVGSASGKWVCGGAVVFPWGSSGKLKNCLVAGNRWTPTAEVESDKTLRGAAGVVFHSSTSGAQVENCTIVNNAIAGPCHTESGAGVRCDWDSKVRNCAIAGNRISENEYGETRLSNLFVVDGHDAVRFCVTDDANAINEYAFAATTDRMFKAFDEGDYMPMTGGALVNRGGEYGEVPAVDLLGNPRVKFDTIDVGCYECQMKLGISVVIR